MTQGEYMRSRLQLLSMAFLLVIGSAFAAAAKPAYQSYIGEYSERHTSETAKVDFPRCRQINSGVLASGSNEWSILSECDIDQPKVRSIRIWRTRLEPGVGLKIHGEIILPWRKISRLTQALDMCNRKGEQQFSVAGYIDLGRGKVSIRSGIAYFLSRNDGTIEQVPYTEIDSCFLGEGGTLTERGIR